MEVGRPQSPPFHFKPVDLLAGVAALFPTPIELCSRNPAQPITHDRHSINVNQIWMYSETGSWILTIRTLYSFCSDQRQADAIGCGPNEWKKQSNELYTQQKKINAVLSSDAWTHSCWCSGFRPSLPTADSGKSINRLSSGKVSLVIKNHIQKHHLYWQLVVPGDLPRKEVVQTAQNTCIAQFSHLETQTPAFQPLMQIKWNNVCRVPRTVPGSQ